MRKLLFLFGLMLLFSSCGWLNPSVMFKTHKAYQYAKNLDSTKALDYKISPNDILEFSMYSNDGFKLVDLTSLNAANMGYRFESNIQYIVASDGTVKLPVLGRTKITGNTIREAESLLEEKYASFYVRPYVIMSVSNKRVIVFPGSAGDSKVIPLVNNNTTLLEALALAGGIADHGKAKKVKLIRQKDEKTQEVFLIDLSTIEGIKLSSTVLQANDIIYVQPSNRYLSKFVQETAPIMSILTSILILFTYTNTIAKNN